MAEIDRMGRCARLAWEHAAEGSKQPPIDRPGVTTGHILLGVLMEQTCAGGLVLGKLGIDFAYSLALTKFVLQYGRHRDAPEPPTVDWAGVPHTAAAKQVLELCIEEANLFTPTYPIGTEHLLLSLLRVEGTGSRILNYLDVDEAKARTTRDEIWAIMRTQG
ncbi:MAG TPA: Clp protease N-terminal domain-containing protein [Chloroflexota bacterium]